MKPNPAYPESRTILANIRSLEVAYLTTEGTEALGIIEIHESVADDVKTFFHTARSLDFPIEKITPSSEYNWEDPRLTSANVTSGFNYRPIAGTTRLSLHSYGLAFDVNPRLNPYIRFADEGEVVDPEGATYDPGVAGTLTPTHPLVRLMKELGWEWGGDWTRESGRTDYQHFQKNLTEITDKVQ